LCDFFLAALFFLGLAEEVRLKELVFSLDLLVVLFHGFEALDKLFDAEAVEVYVGRVEVGGVLVHFTRLI
jgi:hypothetical protein